MQRAAISLRDPGSNDSRHSGPLHSNKYTVKAFYVFVPLTFDVLSCYLRLPFRVDPFISVVN